MITSYNQQVKLKTYFFAIFEDLSIFVFFKRELKLLALLHLDILVLVLVLVLALAPVLALALVLVLVVSQFSQIA